MRTMKAVQIHKYGGPAELTYEDVPYPELREDDVLVRVHAAAVNRFEVAVREGYMTNYLNLTLPAILGYDVSGTIEAIGSRATGFEVGDSVYARADIFRNGTYAEYVAISASNVALKPRSLDHIQASAVPQAALASWQCLFDTANLTSGQTVLIHGAAGGVGHFAVQLAKWRGARVIGTASAHNLDFLRQLGADQVIDYPNTPFEKSVQQVDVVLDTIGGDTQERSWAVLKPGGFLVALVQAPSQETANEYGVRQQLVGTQPNAGQLAEIAALIDAGVIKPTVSAVFPLQEVQRATELIETGHTRGKIVLQVVQ